MDVKEEIKVLELFSGYGGASHALTKANIPHRCIGYSDIEDCANYIFALNHGEDIPALGDVTKINPDDLEDFDLLTAGWPCTDVSIAGLRDLSRGKTILFFEVIRILKAKKPRYFLGENVQGLLSHNHGKTMEITLNEIKKAGYYVKWKLLFSKEHGTPQNRPRVWFACFREKEDYNKFMFPEKEELKITVKDLLEDEVDEKYYLSEQQLNKIGSYYSQTDNEEVCSTITASDNMKRAKHMNIVFNATQSKVDGCPIINYVQEKANKEGKPQQLDIYHLKHGEERPISTYCPDDADIHRTLQAGAPKELLCQPIIVDDGASEKFRSSRSDGICPTFKSTRCNYAINTLTTGYGRQGSSQEFMAINKQINQHTNRWRRLTPRECFRLQGFFKDQIKFGNLSDSKLYFLAGNGWDINTASKIFSQMFKGNKLNKQKSIGEFL